MANTTIPIPPGFRFVPSDEQLISYFLERKVRGIAIHQACPIWERELYGAAPWNVLNEDDPCWEDSENPNKKIITVFVKLKFVNESTRNRVVRTAGCGTWGGKAVTQDVKNSRGEVIGHKKSFTFKPHTGYETEIIGKGHWIMHEFSLVAAQRNQSNGDYVICRITKELSKDATNSNVSTTTSTSVETNQKRKSPSSTSTSCASNNSDHLPHKKACCSGVYEDLQSLESTMPYLTTMLNQETVPCSSSSEYSCNMLNIGNAEQRQQIPAADIHQQVIPYSSQPLPSSLVDDHLMHQQHEFAPAPWGNNYIDVENIDEYFWNLNAADVLGADFVI